MELVRESDNYRQWWKSPLRWQWKRECFLAFGWQKVIKNLETGENSSHLILYTSSPDLVRKLETMRELLKAGFLLLFVVCNIYSELTDNNDFFQICSKCQAEISDRKGHARTKKSVQPWDRCATYVRFALKNMSENRYDEDDSHIQRLIPLLDRKNVVYISKWAVPERKDAGHAFHYKSPKITWWCYFTANPLCQCAKVKVGD